MATRATARAAPALRCAAATGDAARNHSEAHATTVVAARTHALAATRNDNRATERVRRAERVERTDARALVPASGLDATFVLGVRLASVLDIAV
jgi:hypothetical protein